MVKAEDKTMTVEELRHELARGFNALARNSETPVVIVVEKKGNQVSRRSFSQKPTSS
jgi:hypothetical protein